MITRLGEFCLEVGGSSRGETIMHVVFHIGNPSLAPRRKRGTTRGFSASAARKGEGGMKSNVLDSVSHVARRADVRDRGEGPSKG